MTIYETRFSLTNPVNDIEAAQAYLSDDDMTQYLDDDMKAYVESIEWKLDTDMTGRVVVKTFEKLSEDMSKKISAWISGQNSDGLGEGFEQQPFAEFEVEPDCDRYCDCEPEFFYASFDWQSNKYELSEISENSRTK
jgi:hypothetical protein